MIWEVYSTHISSQRFDQDLIRKMSLQIFDQDLIRNILFKISLQRFDEKYFVCHV